MLLFAIFSWHTRHMLYIKNEYQVIPLTKIFATPESAVRAYNCAPLPMYLYQVFREMVLSIN